MDQVFGWTICVEKYSLVEFQNTSIINNYLTWCFSECLAMSKTKEQQLFSRFWIQHIASLICDFYFDSNDVQQAFLAPSLALISFSQLSYIFEFQNLPNFSEIISSPFLENIQSLIERVFTEIGHDQFFINEWSRARKTFSSSVFSYHKRYLNSIFFNFLVDKKDEPGASSIVEGSELEPKNSKFPIMITENTSYTLIFDKLLNLLEKTEPSDQNQTSENSEKDLNLRKKQEMDKVILAKILFSEGKTDEIRLRALNVLSQTGEKFIPPFSLRTKIYCPQLFDSHSYNDVLNINVSFNIPLFLSSNVAKIYLTFEQIPTNSSSIILKSSEFIYDPANYNNSIIPNNDDLQNNDLQNNDSQNNDLQNENSENNDSKKIPEGKFDEICNLLKYGKRINENFSFLLNHDGIFGSLFLNYEVNNVTLLFPIEIPSNLLIVANDLPISIEGDVPQLFLTGSVQGIRIFINNLDPTADHIIKINYNSLKEVRYGETIFTPDQLPLKFHPNTIGSTLNFTVVFEVTEGSLDVCVKENFIDIDPTSKKAPTRTWCSFDIVSYPTSLLRLFKQSKKFQQFQFKNNLDARFMFEYDGEKHCIEPMTSYYIMRESSETPLAISIVEENWEEFPLQIVSSLFLLKPLTVSLQLSTEISNNSLKQESSEFNDSNDKSDKNSLWEIGEAREILVDPPAEPLINDVDDFWIVATIDPEKKKHILIPKTSGTLHYPKFVIKEQVAEPVPSTVNIVRAEFPPFIPL